MVTYVSQIWRNQNLCCWKLAKTFISNSIIDASGILKHLIVQ